MLVITHVVMLSEHNTLRICLHSPLETNNTYKLVFSKNTLSKDFSSIYIGKKKSITQSVMLSILNHNKSSNKTPMYLKIIVWFAYMHDIGTANMQCQAKLQSVLYS